MILPDDTDVRIKRQLISAGASNKLVFLWYEHYRRIYHQHFFLFLLVDGEIKPLLAVQGDFGHDLADLDVMLQLDHHQLAKEDYLYIADSLGVEPSVLGIEEKIVR